MTSAGARAAPAAPAAAALVVFAVVAVAVVDDYGVASDTDQQRAIGQAAVDYVLGHTGAAWTDDALYYNRYYGATFEAPLILVERLLGLADDRAVLLSRHLLTHLFFLTGGWFCYLLTWRLFGDRWLALFALLLFLLHPRIYAHSFFNSKDPPFLAMFMLALYLLQRAFRRGTVAAFALCGVSVGVLVNLRFMGLALFAAAPALRALDLVQAGGPAERRRVLGGAAAFVLAAAGTLYAASPYLRYLLERFPDSTLSVDTRTRDRLRRNRAILPAEARRRIVVADDADIAADFYVNTRFREEPPFGPVLHARRIYHNTVLEVIAVDLAWVDEATAAPYRAAYRATVAGEPLWRSQFALYFGNLDGRTLTWVKEPCRPQDTTRSFVLRTFPVTAADLPLRDREGGVGEQTFRFGRYGVRFDGHCLLRRSLPDYPLRAFEVGRWAPGAGNVIEAAIDLRGAEPAVRAAWPQNRYWQAHAAIAAGERGAPAVRAAFDLYLDAAGATLTYHKEPCAAADLRERFFLHLFPADAAELAAEHRARGFHNRSFAWREHGALLGSVCVALAPLPAYARGIARIRTGQYVSGQGQLWQAELAGRVRTGE